jgi:hypothetical protein
MEALVANKLIISTNCKTGPIELLNIDYKDSLNCFPYY